VRIESDRSCSSATSTRSRVASQQTDKEFADTLASAVQAGDAESDTHPPELSAATYRLFAAIDLARGDTEHAALHLSRVPDAREAGLPLHPSGLLSEVGRWDYTEAAAALPQTGRFDTATRQGEPTFIPYNTRAERSSTGDRTETAAASDGSASADTTVDRLRGRFATLADATRAQTTRIELRDGIETLRET
jgi:hypothetical protein